MQRFNYLLAVFLVLIMIFSLSLSVLAIVVQPAPKDDTEDPVAPTKEKGNNGIGNGLDPQPPGDPQENDTDVSNLPPGQLKKVK